MAKKIKQSLGQSARLDGSIEWKDDSEIIRICDKCRDNALNYKKPFIEEWHKNEDFLYGKRPPSLTKRSNIRIPLLAGFEDTLLSRIKTPITLAFEETESSDVMKARKVTSFWEFESSVTKEDWEYKDILTKKLAMVSGRGISKIYATYPYQHHLDPVDHYDFWIDPLTNGLNIESARYLGQDNIVLSKAQLMANKSYEKKKVEELIAAFPENATQIPDTEDNDKANRLSSSGADYSSYLEAGDPSYIFTEAYVEFDGVRCYILYNREKKIIIKKRKLSEITGFLGNAQQPFYPYESWAYYPDLFNFWSVSPFSRVREIFELRNVALNQIFDNAEARNKPQRAYDPKVYLNPDLLKYNPDGLIPVADGRNPANGIYTFETPGLSDSKSVSDIIEDLTAKITGITTGAAGSETSTSKVGIYYGNMQEVEKRMTLFELSYNRFHIKLGQKYLINLQDRLDKETSVKVLGPDGIEYQDLTQDDLVNFDISISGGLSKANEDSLSRKSKAEFLSANNMNELLNRKVVMELAMGIAGFGKDEIKRALEPNQMDEKQMVKADEDIQKILLGRKFRPYLKADTTYMQRILDYAYNTELAKDDEEKILAYLGKIQPIVIRNMYLKAQMAMAQKGLLATPEGATPTAPGTTPAEAPMSPVGETQVRAQEMPSKIQEETANFSN